MVALEGEPIAWSGVLAVRWDGEGPRLHRGRVRGPARITVNAPVRLVQSRGRLVAREERGELAPQPVVLCGGAVLEVAP